MRGLKISIISILVLAFLAGIAFMATAEDTQLLKGKLVSIDKAKKSIVIQEKSGKEVTIYFEDDSVFSRIERLKIEIGEKVSVRYIIKGDKKIGTYIRSLRGC